MENNQASQSSFLSKLNNAVASIPLEKMLDTIDMAIEAFDKEKKIIEKEKKEEQKKNLSGLKSSSEGSKQPNEGKDDENGGKGFIEVSTITLKLVKKILELLLRWRPVANKALDTSINTKDSVKAALMTPEEKPDAAMGMSAEDLIDQDYLDMLEQMAVIAAEDGILSPEEERYLLNFCDEAGIDGHAFITEIKKACQTN